MVIRLPISTIFNFDRILFANLVEKYAVVIHYILTRLTCLALSNLPVWPGVATASIGPCDHHTLQAGVGLYDATVRLDHPLTHTSREAAEQSIDH